MIDIAAAMAKTRTPYREYGLSAVDAYCGHAMKNPIRFFLAEGSVIELARMFEDLEYPSLPYADALLGADAAGYEARFLCVEDINAKGIASLPLADFRRDPAGGRYFDPRGAYPLLRRRLFETRGNEASDTKFFETALLFSRLEPAAPLSPEELPPLPASVSPLWQKDLLSLVLQGPYSPKALEFLKESGFIRLYWPELADLLLVDHAKDCHPEGGGWSHTMEALGCRKSLDLTLSLAILLHDIGKPRSETNEGRRFDRHAEIGARLASRFLRNLGFDEKTIDDVYFMIRWHMLPAALPRIPLSAINDVVLDERFADLLELYRCDEFSSFKGPENYYASCAAYKAFIKHNKNPYRDRDGKKIASPLFFYQR